MNDRTGPRSPSYFAGFIRLLRARWRVLATFAALGITGGVVVTLLQASGGKSPLLAMFSSIRHRSTATIQIHPPPVLREADPVIPGYERPPISFDAYLDAETDKITRLPALNRVVESLELSKRWALDPESATKALRRSITVSRVGDGGLVEISATVRDSSMARDIAAETARAFRNACDSSDDTEFVKSLEELKKQIRLQEDTEEQARKLLAQIARVKEIVLPGNPEPWNPPDTRESAGRVRLLQARLALLDKASADPALALAIDTPDNPVKAIYPKYAALKARLGAAPSGEPPAADLERETDALAKQLEAGVARLRAEATAALALARIEQTMAVDEARSLRKERAIAALNRCDFEEAKRVYEMEAAWLDQLKLKRIQEETYQKLSPGRVTVIEDPLIAPSPYYGDEGAAASLAPTNLTYGTVAGLLLGLAVAGVMEARASVPRLEPPSEPPAQDEEAEF